MQDLGIGGVGAGGQRAERHCWWAGRQGGSLSRQAVVILPPMCPLSVDSESGIWVHRSPVDIPPLVQPTATVPTCTTSSVSPSVPASVPHRLGFRKTHCMVKNSSQPLVPGVTSSPSVSPPRIPTVSSNLLIFRSSTKVRGYFSVCTAGGLHEFADSRFGHVYAIDSLGGRRRSIRQTTWYRSGSRRHRCNPQPR